MSGFIIIFFCFSIFYIIWWFRSILTGWLCQYFNVDTGLENEGNYQLQRVPLNGKTGSFINNFNKKTKKENIANSLRASRKKDTLLPPWYLSTKEVPPFYSIEFLFTPNRIKSFFMFWLNWREFFLFLHSILFHIRICLTTRKKRIQYLLFSLIENHKNKKK